MSLTSPLIDQAIALIDLCRSGRARFSPPPNKFLSRITGRAGPSRRLTEAETVAHCRRYKPGGKQMPVPTQVEVGQALASARGSQTWKRVSPGCVFT
jgi:hypothetical protein